MRLNNCLGAQNHPCCLRQVALLLIHRPSVECN
ncbi:Uncharacterised protein [Vibrio cholerae]|nr:Uncharacterised protein [Vibrio cholerae]